MSVGGLNRKIQWLQKAHQHTRAEQTAGTPFKYNGISRQGLINALGRTRCKKRARLNHTLEMRKMDHETRLKKMDRARPTRANTLMQISQALLAAIKASEASSRRGHCMSGVRPYSGGTSIWLNFALTTPEWMRALEELRREHALGNGASARGGRPART
jgi:hypothetical protein